MIVVLLLISLLYALLTLLLGWGWRRSTAAGEGPSPTVFLTVVIPVRNEARNLPHLLKDLGEQSYPHFEVIVADDASTDDTSRLVQQLKENLAYPLTLLTLPDDHSGSPKKRAIAQSIARARGTLILTTDGDCRVGPDWLLSFAACYARHKPRMITGPVTFRSSDSSLFAGLQTVEFASLIGAGAATLRLGMPTMCNGANLCYEKKAFEAVSGFAGVDHLASGDDELLMHKIARQYPGGVRFLKDRAALVQTTPHTSLRGFYQQRRRWASKWRAYASWHPSALAVFVFISNATPLLAGIGGATGLFPVPLVLLAIGLKTAPEFLFLRAVLTFLGRADAVRLIPLTQLVYPFYVLFFGLAAQKKGFVWKGRHLR